ncbi:MBL fold metallo-hydrolase RNA specificity domain-containing protein [Arthrobacter sp. MMS24-T111]
MSGQQPPALQFLGATDTVTGSRYLIRSQNHRILVDCGLFQGYKLLRDRNRAPSQISPANVDAVILTHAHLDHSGYIPALVRDGFRGPVYSTPGTAELCSLLLPDSGYLQEEEARYADRTESSTHHPPMPLYTADDAVRSLDSFQTRNFDSPFVLPGGIEATFLPAGHILGAAQVHLRLAGHTMHFTGDLGRRNDPLMYPPRDLEPTNVLVTESTYGNRAHPQGDPEAELGEIISRVAKRHGVIMIAAFAVGRAETVLLYLSRLVARHAIPAIPIYLNSPMAIDASGIYQRHREEHRLEQHDFEAMYKVAKPIRSADESKLLNLRGGPMIIISASGMLTGGRILHHLAAYGPDKRNAIILSGYQAGGTRGAALAAGGKHLRIYGQDVHIEAEVIQMEGLSAHADSNELLQWMQTAPQAPDMTYVTHGEPDAADALRARIKRQLGWNVRVPEHQETISLENPR